jgi:hypothetical protein
MAQLSSRSIKETVSSLLLIPDLSGERSLSPLKTHW